MGKRETSKQRNERRKRAKAKRRARFSDPHSVDERILSLGEILRKNKLTGLSYDDYPPPRQPRRSHQAVEIRSAGLTLKDTDLITRRSLWYAKLHLAWKWAYLEPKLIIGKCITDYKEVWRSGVVSVAHAGFVDVVGHVYRIYVDGFQEFGAWPMEEAVEEARRLSAI